LGKTQFQFSLRSLLITSSSDSPAASTTPKFLPLRKQGRPKRYCDDACKMMAYRTTHRDAINRKRRQNRAPSEAKGRRYARA